MDMWVIVVAAAVLGLAVPYGLMWAFHGPNRADARGRRVDHSWRRGRRS